MEIKNKMREDRARLGRSSTRLASNHRDAQKVRREDAPNRSRGGCAPHF